MRVFLTRAQREAVKAQCRAKGLPAKAMRGWLDQAAVTAGRLRSNGLDEAEIAECFRVVVAEVDADGPLMRASERGDGDAVVALLEAGADPNCRDAEARSPLIWFAYRWREASALVAAGADVHARDNIGRTALHWAVVGTFMTEGDGITIPLLLAAGANPQARDYDGRTAADLGESARDGLRIKDLPGGGVEYIRGSGEGADRQWAELTACLADSARAERYAEAAQGGDWSAAIRIAVEGTAAVAERAGASRAERRDWIDRRALALAKVKPGGTA